VAALADVPLGPSLRQRWLLETEFAAGVVADWRLELSPAAFLGAFQDWPTRPLPGAVELVAQTRASIATG